MARKKVSKAKATKAKRATRAPKKAKTASKAVLSKIEKRAYQIFEENGYNHGQEVENWLEAERQVLGKLK